MVLCAKWLYRVYEGDNTYKVTAANKVSRAVLEKCSPFLPPMLKLLAKLPDDNLAFYTSIFKHPHLIV